MLIKRFIKAFQWLWWTVGSVIITVLLVFALLLNIARIATPWLNRHPQIVLKQIHDYWPGRIQFKDMHWSWSWMSPQVVLNDVSISMPKNGDRVPASFYAQHLRLALNLITSIEHFHVDLNAVEVHGTNVVVRQKPHGYVVNGYFIKQSTSHKSLTLNDILHAFSTIKVGEVILSKVDVQLFLENQKPMAVHMPYLLYSRQSDYRAYGAFSVTPDAVQTMHFWAKEDNSGKHGSLGLQFQHIDVGHIRTWPFVQALLKHMNHRLQPIRRLSTDLSGGVWMRLQQDRIVKLQTQLAIHRAYLIKQGNLKAKPLGDLSANIAYVRQAHQWQLSADHMKGIWGGRTNQLGAFLLTHHNQKDQPHWQFVGNQLWLGAVSHPILAIFAPNSKYVSMAKVMQPQGWLSYISFQSAQAKKPWNLQLQFNQAQWLPYHKIPGVVALSGNAVGTEYKGVAQLTQMNGELNYPYAFDRPWLGLKTAMKAHWSYQPNQSHWQLLFDNLEMDNATIHVQTSGTFNGNGLHAPVANLHGHFNLNDVSQVGHYIPIIKIKPKLHHWLASSFSKGFVNNGELVIQGLINKFPFEHQEGHFLASGEMHHITMHYDPDWPAIHAISGRLVFKNGGMSIDNTSATLPHIQLSNTRASLPDYKQAELTIDNGMKGDLIGLSHFLKATPLSVSKVFQSLQGQGDFSGKLHLFLPLKDLSEDTKVDGALTMRDSTWQAQAWESTMTHVNGQVHFTQDGVDAPAITGIMFDSPVALCIDSVPIAGYAKPITQVRLTGVLPVNKLMHVYVPLLEPFVSGRTSLTMMLNVYNNAKHQDDELNVDSNLQGVTIHLPDMIGKQAQTSRSLHIHMAIGDAKTVLNARYGKYLKARSVLQASPKGQILTSQQVTVGNTSIPAVNDKGVAFAIKMPALSLNKWYALYEKTIADAPPSANPLALTYGSIILDHGSFYHQDLTGIHAVVKQADQQWLWRIMSSRISGVGSIPIHKGMQPWHVQLKYVHLRSFPDDFIASQKHQAQQSTFMPSQIPQMNVDIKDFTYDKYALHTLGFNVNHPTADSIQIHPLYLGDNNLHLNLQLEGKRIKDDNPYWHIYGKVQGNNFGQGLQSLGLPVHLNNTQGSIDVNAYVHQRWPVSAWSKLSKVLNATANVHLTNGSITDLSASLQSALAALKVVNSLSIQSLPARLSNKAKPGSLYFTQLTAAAALYYEKWRLQGLTMKAPDMQVTASGEGEVPGQTLDVWLKVEPHLTGSAPVIAAIAFNPIIGIASWFVNKLVVSPIVSKAAGKEYHIFGQWSDIKVRKVNAK